MRQPRAALSTEGPQPRNPDDDDAAESGSLLPNASPDLDAEIFAISLPVSVALPRFRPPTCLLCHFFHSPFFCAHHRP